MKDSNIYIYSKRPYVLPGPYFPSHEENRMLNEGDTIHARESFIKDRFTNLDHLLSERYSWMNKYIDLHTDQYIIEIGSGTGLSPLYLHKKPILTDSIKNTWIDHVIDATNMDFENDSIDVMIASHTIHHFYSPYKFFMEALRVLKEDGILLIQEVHCSLIMRILLRIMRHEGWSYDVDIFDPTIVVNDPKDPWSANCAVSSLLFENPKKFESTFHNTSSSLKIIRNELCEFSIFPLSGGVTAKTSVPRLPKKFLRLLSHLDNMLVNIAPNIFALGRRIVIQKCSTVKN